MQLSWVLSLEVSHKAAVISKLSWGKGFIPSHSRGGLKDRVPQCHGLVPFQTGQLSTWLLTPTEQARVGE